MSFMQIQDNIFQILGGFRRQQIFLGAGSMLKNGADYPAK